MLQITGKVVNLYTNEAGVNKDGAAYDARHKVQLLGAIDLPNGDVKNDLIDLTVDDLKDWQAHNGKKLPLILELSHQLKAILFILLKRVQSLELMEYRFNENFRYSYSLSGSYC